MLLKPRFSSPNDKSNSDEPSEAMSGILSFAGTGIAAVLRRFKDFIRLKADAALAGSVTASGKVAAVPVRQRATLYLAGVLSNASVINTDKPTNPSGETSPIVSPQSPMPDVFALPTDVSDALASRMTLIRRRIGNDKGMWAQAHTKAYLAEFRKALKAQDPMEIAAIACEFWVRGQPLNSGAMNLQGVESADSHLQGKKESDQLAAATRQTGKHIAKAQDEELLTTDELALRIRYDVRTLREVLKDKVLFADIHYLKPFGRRKILWRWEAIKTTLGINELKTETP
jgi:hypothetical protein